MDSHFCGRTGSLETAFQGLEIETNELLAAEMEAVLESN